MGQAAIRMRDRMPADVCPLLRSDAAPPGPHRAAAPAIDRVLHWPRAYRAAWSACVLSSLAAAVLLHATDTVLNFHSGLVLGGFVVGDPPSRLHARRPVPWISALTGGVTVATWGEVTVGIIALAAVRAHAPLADIWLARADAMVGADTHVPNRTLVHRLWMVEDGP